MLATKSLSYAVGEKTLIHPLSLTFSMGKLYGILGPNGSGKSTLLKLLNGILKASHGNVFWENSDLHQKSRRDISQIIAYMPQHASSCFDFTVEEYVSMGSYSYDRLNKSIDAKRKMTEVLELTDTSHLSKCRLHTLSGGEKQRVSLARALMTNAPVLLLDEPTSSLDIAHQLGIWQLLQEIAAAGKLVITTLHDIGHAERFCDELLLLSSGHCLSQASPPLSAEQLGSIFGVKKCVERISPDFALNN